MVPYTLNSSATLPLGVVQEVPPLVVRHSAVAVGAGVIPENPEITALEVAFDEVTTNVIPVDGVRLPRGVRGMSTQVLLVGMVVTSTLALVSTAPVGFLAASAAQIWAVMVPVDPASLRLTKTWTRVIFHEIVLPGRNADGLKYWHSHEVVERFVVPFVAPVYELSSCSALSTGGGSPVVRLRRLRLKVCTPSATETAVLALLKLGNLSTANLKP